MNKIEKAISNIHYIDNKANSSDLINRIHPLAKLLVTIIYIALVTSVSKYDLNSILSLGLFLIFISNIFNLSIRKCIEKMKLLFILLFFIGIANPILDRTIVFNVGIIPITTGMISMIVLFLKGMLSLICSYFLIITTSIESICYALKIIHIPNLIITVIMLIYRYIIVFLKETSRIWIAYSMRAPKQNGINYKVWGTMIGSALLRSIDKAQIVYESMELRGYNPDNAFIMDKKIFIKSSYIYFIVALVCIIILRFVPIVELIGNLFV